jgi:NADH-quinone oxidoreductase subunit N
LDILFIKSFFVEIFLSFSLLFQLFFNSSILTFLRYNFPILVLETFSQSVFIVVCCFILNYNNFIEGFFFNFLFLNDISSLLIKSILILLSIFLLFLLVRGSLLQNLNFFEYFNIFLISLSSLLLLINSADMLMSYLLLEIQTLSFYILSIFKRNSAFSVEAGLKYFISGSFISGIFLLGCSIIYGLTGTLNLNSLNSIFFFFFDDFFYILFLTFSLILIIVVFFFKISLAPFHFWSLDVYEGAPISSTVIFGILPKISIFYFFMKWFLISTNFFEIKIVLISCGFFSILLGSFFAIFQNRLKRFALYSSIAQVGFMIVAFSNLSFNSFVSIYFYLFVYLLSSLLLWINILSFLQFQYNVSNFDLLTKTPLFLSSISYFFQRNKIWSFSNLLIFFSFAGIPPLSGFLSKMFILLSLIESNNLITAFCFVIVSSISVFYYLRVIKLVFFENNFFKINLNQILVNDFFLEFDCLLISVALFLLLFLFFYPTLLVLFCNVLIFNISFF